MRTLVTGKQMKEIDAHAILDIGIPSVVLMERAAWSIAEEIEKRMAEKTSGRIRGAKRVLAVCGTGNNGADGAAVARMLFLHEYDVTVLMVGDPKYRTEEMQKQLAIDRKLGIKIAEIAPDTELSGADELLKTDGKDFWKQILDASYDIVIDALFGVGLVRNLEGIFAEAVDRINTLDAELTVAVDLPSGIHAETGKIMKTAVRADLTVTFGFEKVGMALYPGKEFCGETMIKDIGFPPYEGKWERTYYTYDKTDLKQIPKRRDYSHKGTYGNILVAAGSKGMCGAAYLSALAAYRSGAGLVKILTVEENREILQNLLPEAIISVYSPDMEEEQPEKFSALIEKECTWASVIVLGPGLGKGRYVAKLIESVLLSAYVPIILDADALNTVAEYPYLTDYFTENVIITPHLGEMARLTEKEVEEIQEDLVGAAVEYGEKYGITCVLKDAATVAAGKDGRIYINSSGNAAMAKAGSGDVLTGVIAGLLALGLTEDEAAAMGVFVHGLAGERAGTVRGKHAALAGEIADFIRMEE